MGGSISNDEGQDCWEITLVTEDSEVSLTRCEGSDQRRGFRNGAAHSISERSKLGWKDPERKTRHLMLSVEDDMLQSQADDPQSSE